MVTNARSRFWPVLLLLTVIMLVHPPSARADRIDIDDPTVLGPVVLRDVIYDHSAYERFVAEVRYLGGSTRISTLFRVLPTFLAVSANVRGKPVW
jgi:hypothetical protein